MILFERDLFDAEAKYWKEAGAIFIDDIIDDRILKFEPIISRGSIQFHDRALSPIKIKKWPDIRWPFENPWAKYDYLFLLQLDAQYLLNHDAVVISEENTDLGWVLESGFLSAAPMWIRSNSGKKQFNGAVYTEESYKTEYEFLKNNKDYYSLDVDLVIASPKEIFGEYRLIFVGGEYISGSQYKDNVEVAISDALSDDAVKFGIQMGEKYGHLWNGHFVLDIAETPNGPKVVEVNNLLTSGWYGADIPKVINAITTEASKI